MNGVVWGFSQNKKNCSEKNLNPSFSLVLWIVPSPFSFKGGKKLGTRLEGKLENFGTNCQKGKLSLPQRSGGTFSEKAVKPSFVLGKGFLKARALAPRRKRRSLCHFENSGTANEVLKSVEIQVLSLFTKFPLSSPPLSPSVLHRGASLAFVPPFWNSHLKAF